MPAQQAPTVDPLHRAFFTIAPHDTEVSRQCAVAGKNGRSDFTSTEIFPAFKEAVANLVGMTVEGGKLKLDAFRPVKGDQLNELPMDAKLLRDVVWNLEQIRDFNNLDHDHVQALNSNIDKIKLAISQCPKSSKSPSQPNSRSTPQPSDSISEAQQSTATVSKPVQAESSSAPAPVQFTESTSELQEQLKTLRHHKAALMGACARQEISEKDFPAANERFLQLDEKIKSIQVEISRREQS